MAPATVCLSPHLNNMFFKYLFLTKYVCPNSRFERVILVFFFRTTHFQYTREFNAWVSLHRKSILYKEPNKMQLWQYRLNQNIMCMQYVVKRNLVSCVCTKLCLTTYCIHITFWFIRHTTGMTHLKKWQYRLLVTARLLYMFRTLSASIIRSTKNCSSSHWSCTMCSDNRPWTSLLDIYHPDPWLAPMSATTVHSTPDDGRRKRPKHVE